MQFAPIAKYQSKSFQRPEDDVEEEFPSNIKGCRHSIAVSPNRKTDETLKTESSLVHNQTIKQFDIQNVIGDSIFGKIRIVRRKDDPKKNYAMKRISKRKSTTENTVYFIFRERSILQSLRHQGVVMLRYAFQDNDSLYMIYDHSPINFRSIMTKDCMKDPITRMYAAEIALALDYLHQNFITHRDLTPENILIDSSGHVLVSNFSFAISIKQTTPKHAIGSPTYMAPEMSSKKPYRYAVDWWSFGIILFECTYGQAPLFEKDSPIFLANHASLSQPIKSSPARELLYKGLLNFDVNRRLGSADGGLGFKRDIKPHPWFELIDWKAVESREVKPEAHVPSWNNEKTTRKRRSTFSFPASLKDLMKFPKPKSHNELTAEALELELQSTELSIFEYYFPYHHEFAEACDNLKIPPQFCNSEAEGGE